MALLLTLNAGSSSVKFGLYEPAGRQLRSLASGLVEGVGGRATLRVRTPAGPVEPQTLASAGLPHDHHAALGAVLRWLDDAHPRRSVEVVSHRVVHGGADLLEPVVIDDGVVDHLHKLVPLAPLHQPHNLAGIDAAQQAFPRAAQIACFDTSFHRSHPFVADTFALPRAYYDAGVRRYGFHGLSYEFIARALKERHPHLHAGRVIVAHLGNGASMCAMREGRSVASTMGFTALDGLPMGTRCGQIDPGVLLYLMTERGMTAAQLGTLLYQQSGLRGMSGLSNDVRELEASDSPAARDALDYFTDQCRRQIGGLTASLAGLDALVLTGGIGEHAVRVRRDLLVGMAWLGLHLDEAANERGGPIISRPDAPVTVLVLRTDEERMLAEHAARLTRLI